MLAVAAIPGSLLIARVGATLAVTLGMMAHHHTRRSALREWRHISTTTPQNRTAVAARRKRAGEAEPQPGGTTYSKSQEYRLTED